jgi:prepilin-type N-terminal cleavage/methylation domain-containing protein
MNRQKASQPPASQPTPASGGFTMIELLMVMMVITVLLTIGVPTIMRFRVQAKINACRVTVNIVDKAIAMYHGQHNKYPGKDSLAEDLIGLKYDGDDGEEVDDFQPGVGYRLQARGPVYGPWNGVDKLAHGASRFSDAFGQAIVYSLFNADSGYEDNDFDSENAEDGVNINNINDYAKNENQGYFRRDYILMSPSANGKWGKLRGLTDSEKENGAVPTDDVTNFTREQ